MGTFIDPATLNAIVVKSSGNTDVIGGPSTPTVSTFVVPANCFANVDISIGAGCSFSSPSGNKLFSGVTILGSGTYSISAAGGFKVVSWSWVIKGNNV